ncbi:MAG: response regulator [Burkholderiaceae bacterium]|nr:response regulator [Burkholderiaceae bacterium]
MGSAIHLQLGALQGVRILLVEDADTERMLLAEYLQQQGCRIYLASNGQEGFQKAFLVQPDLVLMDVRMPVCDGLTACRLLQSEPQTRDIPVIFLTGAALPEDRVEGLLVGAVDYITKPFNFEEVRLRLTIHLRARNPEPQALHLPASPSPPPLDDILFQTARFRLLQQLEKAPDLNELARMVGTNARRLNEAFKRCVGVTVFEYLREERMKAARTLLAKTALEVQDVALELGFTSGANFSTAFKERFGLSPTQFRLQRTDFSP